jgi:hypothetical protein
MEGETLENVPCIKSEGARDGLYSNIINNDSCRRIHSTLSRYLAQRVFHLP